MRPSLGASGAVLACFAADASYMPDNRVAFIFAPTVSFPISAGLKARYSANAVAISHGVQSVTAVEKAVVSRPWLLGAHYALGAPSALSSSTGYIA